MNNFMIDFGKMKWDSPAPGVREKIKPLGNLKIRLVEFSEDLHEDDWCRKGHIGYLIEGNIAIDFDGKITQYKAGNGVYIPGGEISRHKAKIAKGEKALFIFIEKAN